MRQLLVSMPLLLVACADGGGSAPSDDGARSDPDDDPVNSDEGDDDSDVVVDPDDTDTDVPADTGTDGVVFDCAQIPPLPLGFRRVPGARGYHDVAFDTAGHIIGANGVFQIDLLKVDFKGAVQVFVPSINTVQQFAWLPNGELAVASDTRGLLSFGANGSQTVINANIRAYGLKLGPDDMLYAADQDRVHQVDPETGEAQVIVPSGALAAGAPRVLDFSLDYGKLYMGTFQGNGGRIYEVELDADLNPVGPPEVFVSGVGSGAYHDSLALDICGYMYVADYSSSALYRISTATGQVQQLLEENAFLGNEYGHGLEWGNGVGGWLEDAIYLPQPYHNNTVMEVQIGVPSRHWDKGVAINVPQP